MDKKSIHMTPMAEEISMLEQSAIEDSRGWDTQKGCAH